MDVLSLVRPSVVRVMLAAALLLPAPLVAQSPAAGSSAAPVGTSQLLSDNSAFQAHPLRFRPDVSAGVVYDDNVLLQPDATASSILRFSPSFDISRQATRLTLDSRYQLDAERYLAEPELSTPVARQRGHLRATLRADSRNTFRAGASYQRSQYASELNSTTGLGLARQRASTIDADLAWALAIGPHTSATAAYALQSTSAAASPGGVSNHVGIRVTREINTRDAVHLGVSGERWSFDSGRAINSSVGTIGWSRRLSNATAFSAEVGPRIGPSIRPEVLASLNRQIASNWNLSISYNHTRTVAIGLADAIDSDRASASLLHRTPASKWDILLTIDAYRSVIGGHDRAFSQRGAAVVGRSIGRTVWLVASLESSFDDQLLDGGVLRDEAVRRNAVALSIRLFQPNSR